MPERFDLRSELNPAFQLKRRDVLRAAAATLILSVSPVSLAAVASIVAVRVWPAEAYTRVTIESSEPLTFNQFLVKDPERLVVDLNGIDLNSELQSLASKVGSDDPYIKLLRAGRNKPGTVRLVLDLKAQVSPQVFTLEPFGEYKHRLVIDLYPTVQNDPLLALLNETNKPTGNNSVASKPTDSKASDPKTLEAKESEPKAAETVDRSKLKVDRLITVVLDPGHGGEDPGAVGPAGTY
ncbi:MAG: AMIN domain-containing protein, partial [Deefgea sp.]